MSAPTMTAEIAAKLREPFPADVVGKLPRVYCKACRDAQFKVCQQHQREKCRVCGNNITNAHMHLDYVGHAETTDRLLATDPAWTWEPVAFSPEGLPLLDRNGGLWIRLTVAGVTRLGYGSADGKTGPDAIKEAIGDAIRNAAMRFGVALDLWGAKFKDEAAEQDDAPVSAPPASRRPTSVPEAQAEEDPTEEQTAAFADYGKRLRACKTEQDIKNLGQLINDARGHGKITQRQFARLQEIGKAATATLRRTVGAAA